MNKQFFALVAMATIMSLPFITNAQIEKGKFVVGESIGFFKTSQSATSDNSFGKNSYKQSNSAIKNTLSFGYLLNSRMEMGLAVLLESSVYKSSTTNRPGNTHRNSSFSKSIGPYIRYYQPIADNLFFFGQLNASYSGTKTHASYQYFDVEGVAEPKTSYDTKNQSFSSSFHPGFSYLIGNKLGIEFSLGELIFQKYFKDDSSTNSDFKMNFNFSNIILGGRYYF